MSDPKSLLSIQDLLDTDLLSNLIFTANNLSGDEVLVGLLDHGLFSEKVPPCFTTKGLAALSNEWLVDLLGEGHENKLRKEIDSRAHDYIRYEALRDINIPRHLGIPHPESYVVQALAIKKHWPEIKAHCEKPSPQVSRVYVRHVGGGCIFEMNYKGSERYQFEEDEIGWMAGAEFLVKADISACFPSIYTHSISWALHERKIAKKKHGLLELSGNMLDKCTQNTRDRQTNGLLIGPHASNLVSEIILTSIDCTLQKKGYKSLKRHIDDYDFLATSYDEALRFLKDLGLALREYELTINEKKTRILPLPQPSSENWVRELNRFIFPVDSDIYFSIVRSFLDLALELAQAAGTSAPLNYAIKMVPIKLNIRAKRLYVGEIINMALAYPYLVPLLDKYVFERYSYDGIVGKISESLNVVIRLGIRKIYPETIIHGLYLALKYKIILQLSVEELLEILIIDDCLATVLLLEYAKLHQLTKVSAAIKKRSTSLKSEEPMMKDKQWLLFYQTWTETELRGNGQGFLADLKKLDFKFVVMP